MYIVHHVIEGITTKDADMVREHIKRKNRDIYIVFRKAKGYANFGDLFLNSTSGTLPEKLVEIRIIKRTIKAYTRYRTICFNERK